MKKIYTYEKCREAALNYKTSVDFCKGHKPYWNAAYRNGWLKDYTWFENGRSTKKAIYTYDVCKNAALQYNCTADFSKNNNGEYMASCRHGWLKDFTWLYEAKKPYVPDGYWDVFENVEKAAKECNTKKEFHLKYSAAYVNALNNGWIDKLGFIDGNKINGEKRRVWTYEKCYETARKYKYKSDFRNENNTAYKISSKNGWLDKFDWFEVKADPYRTNMHIIYAYEFTETNSVYVGLTINLRNRDLGHRRSTDSSVYRHSEKYSVEIPQPIVLEQGVSKEMCGEREEYFVNKYKSDGWNTLNRAKVGKTSSSKGGVDKKWTHNRVIKIANTCKTLSEFYTKYPSAYMKANEMGWKLDNLSKKKQKNGYWNDKERCHMAALECSSPRDFYLKYSGAYKVSCKNGWIDEWFVKKNRTWNYDNCREFASVCRTKSEFRTLYSQGYKLSVKKGWIDEFFPKAA